MGGNSSSAMNSPVTISASARHTATLIFLHGLGDTGHGWSSAFQMYRVPYIKYICPTASVKPVTLNSGFRMTSWFDLHGLDPNGPEDEAGIKSACELIHELIDNEVKNGIPSNRIILGGFSQGGALAIYSALRYPKPLAGIIGCSCWLPLNKQFPAAAIGNRDTPLLQCHGDADNIVPHKWGAMTSQLLQTFMSNAEFHLYKGGCHSTTDEEMLDIKNFIDRCLPQV